MEVQDEYQYFRNTKKIRVKVVTNRGIQFITTVKHDATVSDLANRALSVYLQLAGQLLPVPIRKQLTVSAVKQGVFYMPKSEQVVNLMSKDDQVEVVIIKAKPKYPQQMFQEEYLNKKNRVRTEEYRKMEQQPKMKKAELSKIIEDKQEQRQMNNNEIKLRPGPLEQSKKLKKKEKKRLKMEMKKENHQHQEEKTVVDVKPIISLEKGRKSEQHIQDNQVSVDDIAVESIPKKKIKGEQILNKNYEKTVSKVIPSPKITFHSQPKVDSPKIEIIDPIKKKQIDSKARNSSEDLDKIFSLQSVLSPPQTFKSPHVQKTPIYGAINQETNKGKQKEQLSNFSLSRKGSEDRKIELKNKKIIEEKQNLKSFIQQPLSSISYKEHQKNTLEKNKIPTVSEPDSRQIVKTDQKETIEKQRKNLLVLQPPSESDSEQTKKIEILANQSGKSKQMIELESRMKSYAIDSEDDS